MRSGTIHDRKESRYVILVPKARSVANSRKLMKSPILLILGCVLTLCITAAPRGVVINVETTMEAPAWAALERRILETSAPAMTEFYRKYYNENGEVQCVLRWGADDGPDDAFEN